RGDARLALARRPRHDVRRRHARRDAVLLVAQPGAAARVAGHLHPPLQVRPPMIPRRVTVLLAVLALGAATAGRAQDSQFGIAGLGTPGRWESVRARSAGGALAFFDALSPFADAALADLGQL